MVLKSAYPTLITDPFYFGPLLKKKAKEKEEIKLDQVGPLLKKGPRSTLLSGTVLALYMS